MAESSHGGHHRKIGIKMLWLLGEKNVQIMHLGFELEQEGRELQEHQLRQKRGLITESINEV